jgi:hypothetical protein
MTYLKEGAEVFVLKSASYQSEKLDLWKNLINSYKLKVSEINVNLNGEIEIAEFENIILF